MLSKRMVASSLRTPAHARRRRHLHTLPARRKSQSAPRSFRLDSRDRRRVMGGIRGDPVGSKPPARPPRSYLCRKLSRARTAPLDRRAGNPRARAASLGFLADFPRRRGLSIGHFAAADTISATMRQFGRFTAARRFAPDRAQPACKSARLSYTLFNAETQIRPVLRIG